MNNDICADITDPALLEQMGCNGTANLGVVASNLLTTIAAMVGVLAVIGIIIGGVQYAISAGDAGKVKRAKNTIMYSLIGLAVALLSWAIVNFVLGNLA